MFSTRQLVLCLVAVVASFLASCQSDRALAYHNFPDAVTNINQVDPAYRKYFADQQGRNYSADDQRKALAAAIRTSRTPVPAYVPRTAVASARKASRGRSSALNNRRVAANRKVVNSRLKVATRSKVSASRRSVAARSKSAKARKSKSVAKRKAAPRRRRG